MRRLHLLLLLIMACAWWGPVSAQRTNIRTYDVSEGLPQGQILAISRDLDGYLWIGTYSGLSRYNGRNWTTYTKREGLPGNQITALLNARDKSLWVGTYGNGITHYQNGRFTNNVGSNLLATTHVNDLLQDKQGRIWVGARQGVLLLDGDNVLRLGKEDGLPETRTIDLLEDHTGCVHVGTGSGVVAVVDDEVRPLPYSPFFQNHEILAMEQDGQQRLWVATNKGLYYLQDDRPLLWQAPQRLAPARFQAATKEPDGGLWFGTMEHGAFKIENAQLVRELSTANGLPNDTIHSFVYDQEQTLWLGSDDGIAKFRPGLFEAFTVQDGLVNDFARALFVDPQGIIWVGTRDGVSKILPDSSIETIDTSQFRSDWVYGISRISDGTMLFATHEGLATLKDGVVGNYSHDEGLRLSQLRSVLCDSRDMIWLGGAGLTRWADNKFHHFPTEHPMGSARVLDIVEDQQGWLWLGTWDGLMRYHPRTGETRFIEGATTHIWDLALGKDGELWIGTNGEGLWHHNGELTVKYTTDDGLIDNFVWQVVCAENGDVWAGTNLGIERLSGGDINRTTHFSKSDGLAANEGCATAVVEDLQGQIWFGTAEGISRYMPREAFDRVYPAPVVMESVTINDNEGYAKPGARLDRHSNTLSFSFAALSLVKEESLEYSYFLEGLESQWTPPSNRTDIKYANLPPRDYTFRVKARNGRGDWEELETRFPFTVKPTFWESWLFRLLLLTACVLLILFYTRLKVKLVERRNQELEAQVRERTEALAEKGREFRELSLSDPLTRARNRRYVTEIMADEITRLKRSYFDFDPNKPFTCMGIILLDLDHFKSVNDEYGHDAGDQLIKEISNRLHEAVRESDVVARWGGEEFLVLLKGIKPQDIMTTAGKILSFISTNSFAISNDNHLVKTCSAGFAYLHPSLILRDVPWEWTFKLADMALYRAKQAGRNCAFGIDYSPDLACNDLYNLTTKDPEEGIKEGSLLIVSNEPEPAPETSS